MLLKNPLLVDIVIFIQNGSLYTNEIPKIVRLGGEQLIKLLQFYSLLDHTILISHMDSLSRVNTGFLKARGMGAWACANRRRKVEKLKSL